MTRLTSLLLTGYILSFCEVLHASPDNTWLSGPKEQKNATERDTYIKVQPGTNVFFRKTADDKILIGPKLTSNGDVTIYALGEDGIFKQQSPGRPRKQGSIKYTVHKSGVLVPKPDPYSIKYNIGENGNLTPDKCNKCVYRSSKPTYYIKGFKNILIPVDVLYSKSKLDYYYKNKLLFSKSLSPKDEIANITDIQPVNQNETTPADEEFLPITTKRPRDVTAVFAETTTVCPPTEISANNEKGEIERTSKIVPDKTCNGDVTLFVLRSDGVFQRKPSDPYLPTGMRTTYTIADNFLFRPIFKMRPEDFLMTYLTGNDGDLVPSDKNKHEIRTELGNSVSFMLGESGSMFPVKEFMDSMRNINYYFNGKLVHQSKQFSQTYSNGNSLLVNNEKFQLPDVNTEIEYIQDGPRFVCRMKKTCVSSGLISGGSAHSRGKRQAPGREVYYEPVEKVYVEEPPRGRDGYGRYRGESAKYAQPGAPPAPPQSRTIPVPQSPPSGYPPLGPPSYGPPQTEPGSYVVQDENAYVPERDPPYVSYEEPSYPVENPPFAPSARPLYEEVAYVPNVPNTRPRPRSQKPPSENHGLKLPKTSSNEKCKTEICLKPQCRTDVFVRDEKGIRIAIIPQITDNSDVIIYKLTCKGHLVRYPACREPEYGFEITFKLLLDEFILIPKNVKCNREFDLTYQLQENGNLTPRKDNKNTFKKAPGSLIYYMLGNNNVLFPVTQTVETDGSISYFHQDHFIYHSKNTDHKPLFFSTRYSPLYAYINGVTMITSSSRPRASLHKGSNWKNPSSSSEEDDSEPNNIYLNGPKDELIRVVPYKNKKGVTSCYTLDCNGIFYRSPKDKKKNVILRSYMLLKDGILLPSNDTSCGGYVYAVSKNGDMLPYMNPENKLAAPFGQSVTYALCEKGVLLPINVEVIGKYVCYLFKETVIFKERVFCKRSFKDGDGRTDNVSRKCETRSWEKESEENESKSDHHEPEKEEKQKSEEDHDHDHDDDNSDHDHDHDKGGHDHDHDKGGHDHDKSDHDHDKSDHHDHNNSNSKDHHSKECKKEFKPLKDKDGNCIYYKRDKKFLRRNPPDDVPQYIQYTMGSFSIKPDGLYQTRYQDPNDNTMNFMIEPNGDLMEDVRNTKEPQSKYYIITDKGDLVAVTAKKSKKSITFYKDNVKICKTKCRENIKKSEETSGSKEVSTPSGKDPLGILKDPLPKKCNVKGPVYVPIPFNAISISETCQGGSDKKKKKCEKLKEAIRAYTKDECTPFELELELTDEFVKEMKNWAKKCDKALNRRDLMDRFTNCLTKLEYLKASNPKTS